MVSTPAKLRLMSKTAEGGAKEEEKSSYPSSSCSVRCGPPQLIAPSPAVGPDSFSHPDAVPSRFVKSYHHPENI
ncbi:hypothetical protein GW17_00050697 [Ensete ventricosum]|nr:hypothetical protein GW17_00050697 [Ensete ventricosum]